ncbi:SCAN domain-containing protein 3 [Helicoverpa armigera]|uniref:SCAN domain-containing protein 3 n=1 Tax=Helicoverpa armigera TaxID=29058 RepID=UPI003082C72C
MSDQPSIVDRKRFFTEIDEYYKDIKNSVIENDIIITKNKWSPEEIQKVIKKIEKCDDEKSSDKRRSNSENLSCNYKVVEVYGKKVLVTKNEENEEVQILAPEDYYDTIFMAHISAQHGTEDTTFEILKKKYLIPRFAVQIFINLCKICEAKRKILINKVQKPIAEFTKRGQVDIIDFQNSPDGEYTWLLLYQDIATKFSFLRPLKTSYEGEVAVEVLKIFLEVGCPYILQSMRLRKFTVSIIKCLEMLWPDLKIVYGSVRDIQQSIERIERIKSMVLKWMADYKSISWSIGCYQVQLKWNTQVLTNPDCEDFYIEYTPFKAFFGVDPTLGLSHTSLPKDIVSQLETEEDLERALRNINKGTQKTDIKEKPVEKTVNTDTSEFSGYKSDDKEDITSSLTEEIDDIKPEAFPISEVSPIDTAESLETKIKEEFLENDDLEEAESFVNDTDVKLEQILICGVCGKDTTTSQTCMACKKVVHVTCSVVSKDEEGYFSKLLCNNCDSEEEGQSKQNTLKRPANEEASSSKKFKDSNVKLPVLIDAAKTTIVPVDNCEGIENGLDKNKLYIVGTASEILNNILPQNEVTVAAGPSQMTLPVATVASVKLSQIKYQCNCRNLQNGRCIERSCLCKRVNRMCDVKCHANVPCANK